MDPLDPTDTPLVSIYVPYGPFGTPGIKVDVLRLVLPPPPDVLPCARLHVGYAYITTGLSASVGSRRLVGARNGGGGAEVCKQKFQI